MSASPIHYPEREFDCKCGKTVRVRTSLELASGMQVYKHCADDEGRLLPPIIDVQEKRDGEWVRVNSYV